MPLQYKAKPLQGGNLPEKIPKDTLNNIPADKDPDVFVANIASGDRGTESVDKAHTAHNKARGCKTLGTSVSVESLRGNNTLEWGVCEAVENLE